MSTRESRDEWDALVEQARVGDMIAVAQAYGAQLRKSSGEFVGACPLCGAGDDRFAVNPRKGVFNCRVCGEGGRGSIDLEMFLGDCDFVEAVKRLTNTTSLSDQHPPIAKDAHKRKQDEARQYEAKQHAKAKWLWSLCQLAAGSPVERYLRARGYDAAIPPTIGYLPARGEHPHAMISAIALPNENEPGQLGEPRIVRSVHLTKLKPDGFDRIREKEGKIVIGRPLGLPIAISSITDGLSLAITEGIEDALAYRVAGFAAWAAGSSPLIPELVNSIPDYITTIIIEQHIDPDGQAQRAVAQLQERLNERQVREGERPVEIIIREAGE